MTATDIKRAREGMGLTQAGLADRLGVAVDTIRSAEQGRRQLPEPARRLLELLAADD